MIFLFLKQIVREKDLLLVPYCKDRDMDIIQWPPFLLASKVYISVACLLPISLLSILVE
jgi:hypothetical protein